MKIGERDYTKEKHEDSDIVELQERYPDIYKAYTESTDEYQTNNLIYLLARC